MVKTLSHLCLAIKGAMTNYVDPDKTPENAENAESDQDLHCLHYT